MQRVYISGKITGLDMKVAAELFEQMEVRLQDARYTPINPMKLVPYDEKLTWADYMVADIAALWTCTAMIMLPNWMDSNGARVEHTIAACRGMHIVYPAGHEDYLKSGPKTMPEAAAT